MRIGGGNASPVVNLANSDSGHLIASCTVDGAVNMWAVRGMQHLGRKGAVQKALNHQWQGTGAEEGGWRDNRWCFERGGKGNDATA
jgi:hypothetical protein